MQRGEKLSGRSVSNRRRRWIGKLLLMVACAVAFTATIGLAVAMLSGGWAGWRVKAKGASGSVGSDKLWKAAGEAAQDRQAGSGIPPHSLQWQLDEAALQRVLEQALPEGEGAMEKSPAVLSLPLPDGSEARFRIVDSPVLAPELAVQYPQIKSYRGQGVDNASLTMRCSWTPSGLSALLTDGVQTVMIQPLAWFRQGPPQRDGSHQASNNIPLNSDAGSGEAQYVSYYGKDYTRGAEEAMCLVTGDQPSALMQRRADRRARRLAAPTTEFVTSRKYKILVATTYEYTIAHGGTSSDLGPVVSSLNARINNATLFLQKELAIQLELVTDDSLLYVTSASSDPFTNGNSTNSLTEMLKEARRTLKSPGLPVHDLGHVFGYVANAGNSGNAYVGVAGETQADSEGFFKDAGVTIVGSLAVDEQATIALMHEIGHQFGATHIFNGTQGNCGLGGGRTGDTAFEPGSGQTIMSLGGACGGDNIVSARSSYFHSGSLAQIREYVDSFGGTVGAASLTGNVPPNANAGLDYVIPKQTPFTLSGSVSDPGQSLTYVWEQIDAGGASFLNPPYGDQPNDPAETTRPLFFLPITPIGPVASGSIVRQTFAGLTPSGFQMAESLPTVARALNFRLTARDNQGTGGGMGSDTVRLEVAGNAGPFEVTAPNMSVTWAAGSSQTVTWNINNTNAAPINCNLVNILFSADGGMTFGTLVKNTANDGTESITLPNISTSQARIKVEAVNNIFFGISPVNFTVTSGSGCSYLIGPAEQNFSSSAGAGNFSVLAGTGCVWTATSNSTWLTITSGASGTGSGTVNYSVAANTGVARVGGITLGGKSFAVVQAEASNSGLLFYPLPRPVRIVDTRSGQGNCDSISTPIGAGTALITQSRITCEGITIPANAQAIVGNITVITPSNGGELSIYPSNTPVHPGTSNLTYLKNDILSNAFTTALSTVGEFSVYSSQTADMAVDVSGYYAPPGTGGLYYHPLSKPVRLLDTRGGIDQFGINHDLCDNVTTPIAAGTSLTKQARITCDGQIIPASALAIVGNVTVIAPDGPNDLPGYLTIYPTGTTAPLAANMIYPLYYFVNGATRQGVVSNYFIVGLDSTGQFNIFAERTLDLATDIAGYYSLESSDVNGPGMMFNPLPRPLRILDTQPNTGTCDTVGSVIASDASLDVLSRLTCEGITIPSVATAVVGSVTVDNQDSNAGYVTLYPQGVPRPIVANMIYWPGRTLANGFFVGLNNNSGQFSIYAERRLHVRVDVAGYFAP